jgi:dienelactone hydrolase
MRRSFVAAAVVLASIAAIARGESKGKDVDYKHGEVALRGYLACDESVSEKRPGVLVVHEWWGLGDYEKSRAEQLEKLGYVAFALDMYGAGIKTNDPAEAGKYAGALKGDRKLMRARAEAGLEILKSNPHVDATRLAAIGYCFGGTTVLELARGGAPLAGVVSFHGDLGTPNPDDAKAFKGKVLVCNGGDDGFVTQKDITAFEDEMRKAGIDWQFISYGGAVHAFTNPEADKHGIKGIGYNAAADRRSWDAMKTFFGEIFKK